MPERFICHTADPDLVRAELLHELFEQKASARPGSLALVCAGQSIGSVHRKVPGLSLIYS